MSSYDSNMPTTYDTPMPDQSSSGIINIDFIKGLRGILKITQTLLTIIAVICACVWGAQDGFWVGPSSAAGWTQFVTIFSLIIVVILDVLYVFSIPNKLSPKVPFNFIELVFYGAFTLFYFISGVVAAVYGGMHSSVGASAFFCFACTIAFAIDVYFCFAAWRMSGEGPNLGSQPTQPDVSHTPSEPSGVANASSVDKGPQY